MMRHARDTYPVTSHSADSEGDTGENIPLFARLVQQFDEWNKNQRSVNTQQTAARISQAITTSLLMEPRAPLGHPGVGLRSQVRSENSSDTHRPNSTSNTGTSNLSTVVLGTVQDSGVPTQATNLVATATSEVVAGIPGNSRRNNTVSRGVSRGSLLSHIQRTRDSQGASVANSLNSLFREFAQTPAPPTARSFSEILANYEIASRNLRVAETEEEEQFYTLACRKLFTELQAHSLSNP